LLKTVQIQRLKNEVLFYPNNASIFYPSRAAFQDRETEISSNDRKYSARGSKHMQAITKFSINRGEETSSSNQSHIRPFFDGKPSDLILSGDTIEYQYALGSLYLVITHYDYWEGTSYWFNLLDRRLGLLDVISPPEEPGFIQDVSALDEHALEFSFFDKPARWRLCAAERPHWDFRPGVAFQRPFRYWFSRRYLTLDRLPAAPSSGIE
jgi:hypothetical protein